jgi:hypothetical protein
LKSYVFPIEATHILMFARAIGDANPAYDLTRTEHVVAPPTFAQASAQFDPDYHLRPKPGEPWFGSGKTASGVESEKSTGNLHAEQHFEYLRPIRAGDVLTVETHDGERWEKQSKRGGALWFAERITDFRDQGGELVCRARAVVVNTQHPPV